MTEEKKLATDIKLISIASLRRQLPYGRNFIAEFIGPLNMHVLGNLGPVELKPVCDRRTGRTVVRQTKHEMASEIQTGTKKGHTIYLNWSGVVAYSREGQDGIVLAYGIEDGYREFLLITFPFVPDPPRLEEIDLGYKVVYRPSAEVDLSKLFSIPDSRASERASFYFQQCLARYSSYDRWGLWRDVEQEGTCGV